MSDRPGAELVPHPNATAIRLAIRLAIMEDASEDYRIQRDRLGADLGRLLEAAAEVVALGHLAPRHTLHLAGDHTSGCLACAVERLTQVTRAVQQMHAAGGHSWPRPIARMDTAPADRATGAETTPPTT